MDLVERIALHAASHPAHPAFIELGSGRTLTYGELARRLATEGERAPRILREANTIDFAPRLLAQLRGGGSVLALSPRVSEPEAEHLARRLEPPAATGHRAVTPGYLFLPTSGSTGEPKLVARSAVSLGRMAEALATTIGFQPSDVVFASVPLAHSYGLEHGLLAPLWAGSTVLLCDHVDRASLRAAFEGYRPALAPVVPPVVEAMVDAQADVSSLRQVYSAGGALPASVAAAFRDRTGLAMGQVYGATEVGSVTFRSGERGGGAATGDVGQPLPGVRVRADEGELQIHSPWMFAGYSEDLFQAGDSPREGERSPVAAERYFPTGDLGHLSASGSLVITGRAKLLIDTGGGKVNPLEVEAVLGTHPAVAECAVVPVPQTETVSRLRAVVVLREGRAATADALRDHVRASLAAHKVPRQVEFRPTLPRSPAGKILRQAL